MAQPTYNTYDNQPRTVGNGYLFGVPMRDLGWFASLLMGLGTGMASFFAGTFVGIVFIMIYNSGAHAKMDYSWSYLRFGLPFGVLVMVLALGYLGVMWARRQVRRG
ncbi:hypothetical protein SAMN05421770_107271 [Granulicella rosea]|uniref:Uncharacterized protein n=1 Tax=Granulicella rosea TaxID=474952 RepID=A0A239LSF6_9BACT|nr:hypothetical protein [Granulicella rosea]SNT33617.1 hypothetical protein SAMN05421770_107271 [Granulicella rosea]